MSTELKVLDSTFWSGIGFVIGWAIAVERRIFGRVTRKELKSDLQEIKSVLEQQDKESKEHRDRVTATLHQIGVKVAVIQTRIGHPPSGDTGTFKR